MKQEEQYLISRSEVSNFIADILSGEKPKPLLEGKNPIEVIAEGEITINDDGTIGIEEERFEDYSKLMFKKVKIILIEDK